MPAVVDLLPMALFLASFILGCITIVAYVMTMSLRDHDVIGLTAMKRLSLGFRVTAPVFVKSTFNLATGAEGPGSAVSSTETAGAAVGSVSGLPLGHGTSRGPLWLPGMPFLSRPSA